MKRISCRIMVLLSVIFIYGLGSALAMPRYTDKENALKMASVLDKGKFAHLKISSTYVINDREDEFYISVVLSDGTNRKWSLDQIYSWSREDKLRLSENRSLIFLNPESTQFHVLDKNKFHKLALRAKDYIKTYAKGDPLEGKTFHYAIKSFNMIYPKETAFGRDKTGSKFRYILDLVNGTRELLTYEDAFNMTYQYNEETGTYQFSEKKRLLLEKNPQLTLEKAYQITKVVPHQKEINDTRFAQFGLEVIFDRALKLANDQFPFEIYEGMVATRHRKDKTRAFFIDITLPNAEKRDEELGRIKNLEYLHNIHLVNDPKYPKRLLLRAQFSPDLMDLTPEVTVIKEDPRRLFISFFHIADQTVTSRTTLMDPKKRRRIEKESLIQIPVKPKVNLTSNYGKILMQARDASKQSNMLEGEEARQQSLIDSIKLYEEAAYHAQTDQELIDALNERNNLREKAVNIFIDFVRTNLNPKSKYNKMTLMQKLDQAESLTQNQRLLSEIEELRYKLEKRK